MTEQKNVFHIFRIFRVFRVFRAFRAFRSFRYFHAFRAFRAFQPVWWILLAGAALFAIILSQWISWYALIALLILGVIILRSANGQILQTTQAQTASTPVYQSTEHPPTSSAYTPYTQGYQAQQPLSASAPGRSPFVPTATEPQPHQDQLGEIYEQPMPMQYPEHQ